LEKIGEEERRRSERKMEKRWRRIKMKEDG
jgi:hypothetical protein